MSAGARLEEQRAGAGPSYTLVRESSKPLKWRANLVTGGAGWLRRAFGPRAGSTSLAGSSSSVVTSANNAGWSNAFRIPAQGVSWVTFAECHRGRTRHRHGRQSINLYGASQLSSDNCSSRATRTPAAAQEHRALRDVTESERCAPAGGAYHGSSPLMRVGYIGHPVPTLEPTPSFTFCQ